MSDHTQRDDLIVSPEEQSRDPSVIDEDAALLVSGKEYEDSYKIEL